MANDVAGSGDDGRPDGDTRSARAATDYTATQIVHRSVHDFATTWARFDTQVPVFDTDVSVELVVGGAGWDEVVDAVGLASDLAAWLPLRASTKARCSA